MNRSANSTSFRRNLLWSGVAHVAIVTVVMLATGFAPPPKPPESIRLIDLTTVPRESAPAKGTPPKQPAPIPSRPPIPATKHTPPVRKPESAKLAPTETPVAPAPRIPEPPIVKKTSSNPAPPEPRTATEPKKEIAPAPAKPQVAISARKVTRTTGSTNPAPATATNPAETFNPSLFAKNLLSRLPDAGGLVTASDVPASSGTPGKFDWYFNRIFEEMYGAWQPPFGAADGLRTQVGIRVEKSGVISRVSLAAGSGNQPMDSSALAAANNVKKLPALPDGLGEDSADITIHFVVKKQ